MKRSINDNVITFLIFAISVVFYGFLGVIAYLVFKILWRLAA